LPGAFAERHGLPVGHDLQAGGWGNGRKSNAPVRNHPIPFGKAICVSGKYFNDFDRLPNVKMQPEI
jgi:hypothetical protein